MPPAVYREQTVHTMFFRFFCFFLPNRLGTTVGACSQTEKMNRSPHRIVEILPQISGNRLLKISPLELGGEYKSQKLRAVVPNLVHLTAINRLIQYTLDRLVAGVLRNICEVKS